jgi:hypothetical protein
VVTCDQLVVVRLQHTCGNNEEYWARLPIQLADVTDPEIAVSLDSNATPHASFGGVLRYLAGDGGANGTAVVPIFTIYDACDSEPDRQYILDGEPYEFGTPITSHGLHFLNVFATDASDNSDQQTYVFEIRERPSLTGVAVVESSHCELDNDGRVTAFNATVLLSALTFDHHQVLLSSAQMFLCGEDGRVLTMTPLAPGGPEINECYFRLNYSGQFANEPLNECPSELLIVGAGYSDGQITFEWGARTPNVPDPTPIDTLATAANKPLPCADPEPPPPPQPPPPCQEVQTVFSVPRTCFSPGTFADPDAFAFASTNASGDRARGDAAARAFAPLSGSRSATASCPPASQQTPTVGWTFMIEQMVGDCCDCYFTILASGSVYVSATAAGNAACPWASFTASAHCSGGVAFDAPCGTDGTEGLAAVASVANNYSSVPNPDTNLRTFDFSCVDDRCSTCCTSFLRVSTYARASVETTATHCYSYAQAKAAVRVLTIYHIEGHAHACPANGGGGGPDPEQH